MLSLGTPVRLLILIGNDDDGGGNADDRGDRCDGSEDSWNVFRNGCDYLKLPPFCSSRGRSPARFRGADGSMLEE